MKLCFSSWRCPSRTPLCFKISVENVFLPCPNPQKISRTLKPKIRPDGQLTRKRKKVSPNGVLHINKRQKKSPENFLIFRVPGGRRETFWGSVGQFQGSDRHFILKSRMKLRFGSRGLPPDHHFSLKTRMKLRFSS